MSRNKLMLPAAMAVMAMLPVSAEAGRIIWPCSGSVTSPYGPRSGSFHHGIDIGVGSGTYLGSPGNGTVTSYFWDSCAGNLMKIGYGNGWETRFLHLSASLRSVGSVVSRNVDVARSGNTGTCTTGPHLHFEVRKDGVSQLVPGSAGTWVSRGIEVPQEYPGFNDPTGPSVVIDNSSPGFSVVGSWAFGSSAADKFGADYRYKSTAAISEPASWNASVGAATYGIYAWWAAGTNRSTAAPYILPNGVSVKVNQQANGGRWNLLGTLSLSGSATTKLSCWASTGFVVVADAIKYQQ